MEKIIWNESYSVGYNPIDFQHKILIGIINDLIETSHSNQENELWLDVVLEELRSYTKYHFSNEAVLMSKHGFEDISSHSEQHAGFIKKLLDFQKEFQENNENVSETVLKYLKNWLVNHIQIEDKKLGSFLAEKEKGQGLNDFPFP
jgi:hemerythrin-like metal-binding protein